jgi:hypothetical protein
MLFSVLFRRTNLCEKETTNIQAEYVPSNPCFSSHQYGAHFKNSQIEDHARLSVAQNVYL